MASHASNSASWFSSILRLEKERLQYRTAFFSGVILQKIASVYYSAASWNFLSKKYQNKVELRVYMMT